jgi:integrase
MALSTEESYCGWVRRFIGFLRSDRGGVGSEERFERFLSGLAREGVAASTQNQAFNAIRFFYGEVLKQELKDVNALRARRPARLRVAPGREAVRALMGDVRDVHGYPTRLIVRMLYGCGLRVNEPLNLRIKDVDFENSRLVIREAKRHKDRVVALPCSLVEDLREQVRVARRFYELDQVRRVPVPLPGLLSRKYRNAPFSWSWYWVFPSARPCEHPRTGEVVRWRVHEANVQLAVRESAARMSLGVITPHHLRHAYGTHALEMGNSIKAIQNAMGHESMETTAGYLHADGLGVSSPLEVLA